MNPKTLLKLHFKKAILAGLIILLLNACSLSLIDLPGINPPTATPPYPIPPASTPQPMAYTTFDVTIPTPLLAGESLIVSIVDEVTGLALNPDNHTMQGVDALHYTVKIPFAVNSIVKYRYMRQTALPVPEDDPTDKPVRYRILYAVGEGVVQDVVASWTDSPFSGSTGRVLGQVMDASNGAPIPNILITAGGQQTLTDSSGAFFLENVQPGTQNLVAYAIDGTYVTFQQGAVVEAGKRTPVTISLPPAPLVDVIFTVIVPSNTIPSAPVRMAGNLLQLGNTFADLEGGLSTVASRMPLLSLMPDTRYTFQTRLPAGADVRYKYTLGDGFWNAEHLRSGEFVLRQFIVPQSSGTVLVQDAVETWQAGPSSPITFELTVPANTPVTDIISIQFNPYGWTEPFPIWSLGNNRWGYTLYSPLNMLGTFEYRYCRNDQCGVADDAQTTGSHRGRPIATSLIPQDLQDTVVNWNWLQDTPSGAVVGPAVQSRTNFWAGIEFQTGYDPTWQAWMPVALQNVQSLGANWTVLTPTWTYEGIGPVVFSPVPGRDPLWTDSVDTITRARGGGMNVALFPAANFPVDLAEWWISTPRGSGWWNAWFERYQAFAVYHADLATKTGVGALILGGEWIAPALPGGTLANGSSSNLPADADVRWNNLIGEVRRHYTGPLYWALTYPGGLQTPPAFLGSLDGVYLLWNAPLSTSPTLSVMEMQTSAGQLMDSELQPFIAGLQKPLVIAVAYPSVTGSASACLPDGLGGCLPWTAFNQPVPDNPAFTLNLQTQVDIYSALLGAVNDRPWIGGFVSRGYFPPVGLQDKSASIHGKPTADLLWYWYPGFLGIAR